MAGCPISVLSQYSPKLLACLRLSLLLPLRLGQGEGVLGEMKSSRLKGIDL